MSDDLLAEYKKITGDIAKLEEGLETFKKKREAAIKALFEKNGKGFIYDLGTGEEMVISTTKIGTHFFTSKASWKGRGRRKKLEAAPEAQEAAEAQPEAKPTPEPVKAAEATPEPTEAMDPLEKALADLNS